MTITTTKARNVKNGNGSTTSFSTDFVFFAASSLTVTLVQSDGTEVVKALTTDYTVSGGNGSTGTVETTSFTPATGEQLVIEREEPFTQGTDFENNDDFDVETVEERMDRIVLQVQRVLDVQNRAPLRPSTADPTAAALTIPEPVASELLVGKSDASGWESKAVADLSGVDLVLPTSSTDQAVTRWSGTNGDTLQDSGVTIDDSDVMTNPAAVRWSKGADIASADPLVLGTDGNYFDVTGTTGFSAITVTAGTLFMLQFDGALTITHGSGITLPGAANITTAAGDQLIGFATATDTVSVLSYVRAADSVDKLAQGVFELPVMASAMVARTSFGAESGTTELASNLIMLDTFDFDAATQEGVQFYIPRMPKSWDEGTLTAIPIWTAASGSGDVVWGISALAVGNNDALDAALGTEITVTDTLITANDHHQAPETAAITAAGTPAEGDGLIVQVVRVAADGGDTLGVDAKLIGVVLKVTFDAENDA